MANNKYEFTGETRTVEINEITYVVKRIKALESLDPYGLDGDVNVGDLGGWIESEENLSQDGMCWVDEEAVIVGKAVVKDNAYVCGRSTIKGEAIICDNSTVDDDSIIAGNSVISGNSLIHENAQVLGNVVIKDNVEVKGWSIVHCEYSKPKGICENAEKMDEGLRQLIALLSKGTESVISGNIVIDSSIDIE